MYSLFTVALTAFSTSLLIKSTAASSCVVFDSNFNLYAFGLGGKDFSLGTQDAWTTGSASDITSNNRPPFDGDNTTCYLSQFFNAIYVINGDKSNPTNIGVYDVQGKAWSIQKTGTGSSNSGSFDYSNFEAILDHDTNVFYALSGANLWDLDFGNLKTAANSDTISWNLVGTPSFSTDGYKPVMALAQNHIHFLNVPNAQPGTAQIFVIHFSFFQPTPQSYPTNSSSTNFPETHGQVTSFFQAQQNIVQQEFAFIPDDGSQTYIINVESNTTAILPGPTDKSGSTFTAGVTSLVQLTSEGNIFFFPYKQDDAATNGGAKWTQIKQSNLPAAGSTSTSSGTSSPTKSGSSSSPSQSGSTTQSGGNGTGAATRSVGMDFVRTVGVIGLFASIGFLI